MHAVQPTRSHQPPVKSPVKPHRPSVRQNIKQRHQQQLRVLTIEATIKLTVHLVLSIYAISALWQIWPRHRNSRERLSQIQSEVQMTQKRLEHQKSNFNRVFDPQQAQSVMQEHTNQLAPGQKQIIWLQEIDESELSQAAQQKSKR